MKTKILSGLSGFFRASGLLLIWAMILCMLILWSFRVSGQCGGAPAFNTPVHTLNDITILTDLQYSSVTTSTQRTLDLYVPPMAECSSKPLAIIIHGGLFATGDKNELDYVVASRHLAKCGYVVANMNYRTFFCDPWTCVGGDCPANQNCFEGSICQILAMQNSVLGLNSYDVAWYKALQDARAAVKFSIGKILTDYEVSISEVVVYGRSAGATTALNLTFASQSEIDTYNPGLSSQLGSIDAFVQPAHANINFSVLAVASEAGALPSLSFLDNSNDIHLISFHGSCDAIFPLCDRECSESDARNTYGPQKIREYISNNGISDAEICYNMHFFEGYGHSLQNKKLFNFHTSITFFSDVIQNQETCDVFSPCPGSFEPDCGSGVNCNCNIQ